MVPVFQINCNSCVETCHIYGKILSVIKRQQIYQENISIIWLPWIPVSLGGTSYELRFLAKFQQYSAIVSNKSSLTCIYYLLQYGDTEISIEYIQIFGYHGYLLSQGEVTLQTDCFVSALY